MPATSQGVFRNSMWLGLIVVCLSFLYFFLPQSHKDVRHVSAAGATHTVCAEGCDFTTLRDAVAMPENGVSSGDTILIEATYNPADEGEFFNIEVTGGLTDITIDCQNNDVTLGGTEEPGSLYLTTSSTIQNCALSHMRIQGAGQNTVTGNTFTTSAMQSVAFSEGNNYVISNNTFLIDTQGEHTAVRLSGGSDHVVSNNTFIHQVTPTSTHVSAIDLNNIISASVTGNSIDFESVGNLDSKALIVIESDGATTGVNVTHNTMKYGGESSFFRITDGTGFFGDSHLAVTANYNILYNTNSSGSPIGFVLGKSEAGSTFTLVNDYNGLYNINQPLNMWGDDSESLENSISLGENTKTGNPYFKINDADDTNDFELAPYSSYLDVNGELDIGSHDTARGNSFVIDDNGAIDYSTVHATSTDIISETARTGDTFVLAAGTYDAFAVADISNLTVIGAGSSTIINAESGENAILLSSVTTSTVQDLVVQNASSTVSSYELTGTLFSYNGNDYDDSGLFGPPDSMFLLASEECDDIIFVGTDPVAVTSLVGDASTNWHVALVSFGEAYVGFWVPGQYASNAVEFETLCDVGLSVDTFVQDVLTVSEGEYTYDSSAATAAGITMVDGYINHPTLSQSFSAHAGIKLAGEATGNLIENITSTGNGYNVWFTGSSHANNITTSTLSSASFYDIYSDSNGDNNIKNVTYTTDSSAIDGDGTISAYYTARWLVQNTSEEVVSGAEVIAIAANEGDGGSFTTEEDGYTPYSDYLLAYILSSEAEDSTTGGGYNPYNVSVAAIAPYSASTTESSLVSPNQTFTITLAEAPTAPAAPSNFATTTIGTTSAAFSWTDNSSGSGQESSFILEYITGTDVSDFPGVTTTVDQDETSVTISDLAPNTQYMFRIAATNIAGTSSYVTSSAFYTDAAVPTSVSASANGQTSIIVSWNANANAPGTVYELYNNTTGATVVTTTETSYTVTGLAAGTSYQFKVRAEYLGEPDTWTDYSSASSAVSTASARSGGGSSPVPAPPVAPQQGIEFTINNTAFSTDDRAVTLSINSPDAVLMAVSNSSAFDGVSYEPYAATKSWILSEGIGTKTVYVKLRTTNGGEKVVSDTIELISGTTQPKEPQQPVSCPLAPGFAYKSLSSNSVYYVTADCTKRAFTSERSFFSYFRGWNEVRLTSDTLLRTVPTDALGFMPWGPLYDPKYGALVKIVSDPKVYLLLGEKKYWITSEHVFNELGYSWNWIEDISEELLAKYDLGEEITETDRHPNFTLVKYEHSPKVYRLEPSETDSSVQVKRHIANETAFNSLKFRWDRIVIIDASETYADGPALTGN